MKKNLKKAISAVIALAVSASLVPATFAAKIALTDVADTASYATAVNTLVALDVINGYEDGTFLPDNLITRAEVTKVIVAALNQTAAAEGMTGATEFTDVAADFWANGFINAGTQIGFINGMGDGTFAPQDNVTYAQVVKMLVSSLGYEDYAQYMGGWPNGYLSIAASEGITKDVKANANDAVTRAQVAQLVFNALNTPIVENTGMEYSSAGILVPTIAKQDGKGDNYYKTLLTENFDAYLVEGYVSGTSKTMSLDTDEVQFAIAKSEKYDVEFYDVDSFKTANKLADVPTAQKIEVYVDDTDAVNYLNVFATAIVMVDEYDDYRFLSFAPSGKNKSVTFTYDLLDTDDYEDAGKFDADFIGVYASETANKATEYDLQKNATSKKIEVDVYVNGYAVADKSDDEADIIAAIETYVYENKTGSVELVDTYRTDGYYDAIYVDYYATQKVEYVDVDAATIQLDSGDEINLDEEMNEDLVYGIYLDGEEITIADLQEDDILSIAYDVKATNIDASDYYAIYVSRDTVTGKVTSRDEKEGYVVIGGEEYKFVNGYKALTMAGEYTVTLDYFGRIYEYEIEATSIKYAVLDKFIWSDSEEAYKATLFTADGVQKVYVYDGEDDSEIYDTVYSGEKGAKAAITDRVIEYKVSSSSGKITSIKFLDDPVKGNEEYSAKNVKIGSVKISEATKIVDAIEYLETGKLADLTVGSIEALVDDTVYEAYAYGTKYSDGTYPFVLILSGEGAYNETTRFAVITKSANASYDEENDEDVYNLPVLYNGEATELVISSDLEEKIDTYKRGQVIFFQTGSDGYVDQIDVIFSIGDKPEYAKLVATLKDGNDSTNNFVKYPTTDGEAVAEDGKNLYADFVTGWNTAESDAIQLVFGPVVDKGNSDFALGSITSVTDLVIGKDADDKDIKYTGLVSYRDKSIKKDKGGVLEIDTSDATNVYVYDFGQSKDDYQLKKGVITATTFAEVNNANEGDTVLWGNEKNTKKVYFAFAMLVDGEATDVLVFKPDSSNN